MFVVSGNPGECDGCNSEYQRPHGPDGAARVLGQAAAEWVVGVGGVPLSHRTGSIPQCWTKLTNQSTKAGY